MRDWISFALELLVPTAMAVFGILYYLDTLDLSEQAIFFPYTLMAVMAILAVLVVVRELVVRLRRPPSPDAGLPAGPDKETGHWIIDAAHQHRNPILVIVFAAGYLYLFILLGYAISTIIFITAFLIVLRVPLVRSLVIGLGFPILLYLVFGLAFGIRI